MPCVTPPNLKITILGINYAPEPTGIAPYTTKLAEGLATAGYEVCVLTGYPHYPKWDITEGYSGWRMEEVINGVHVRRHRHYVPRRVTNFHRIHLEISFGIRLMFARWGNPDVVLVVTPALFSTALVLLRSRLGMKRYPTGVWVQDVYSRGLEETGAGGLLATRLMKKLEGHVLRSATRVSVIHERFKYFIADSLGVEESKVSVIRNWTHIDSPTNVDRLRIRAKLGWGEDDVIVLHAGNMGVKQGLENVVDAARIARERKSRVRFVLLGDGNQRQRIEELSVGVDNLQILKPLPDPEFTAALHSADILLVHELAGLREMAVPSKLTSYFSAGLPIIAATDAASTTADELEKSQGGLRVEPGLPEQLVDAAETLYADPGLSQTMGAAGVAYTTRELSQDAAMVKYMEWLDELAKQRS